MVLKDDTSKYTEMMKRIKEEMLSAIIEALKETGCTPTRLAKLTKWNEGYVRGILDGTMPATLWELRGVADALNMQVKIRLEPL